MFNFFFLKTSWRARKNNEYDRFCFILQTNEDGVTATAAAGNRSTREERQRVLVSDQHSRMDWISCRLRIIDYYSLLTTLPPLPTAFSASAMPRSSPFHFFVITSTGLPFIATIIITIIAIIIFFSFTLYVQLNPEKSYTHIYNLYASRLHV